MAVTSVTVHAPVDGVLMAPGIVRPAVRYAWAGGTGPWDAEIVWDDDPTFANGNGNRQIVTETGIATITTRTVAPTADLADTSPGTQWYLRVTVTDTADAGASSDSDNDFTYLDPNQPRHRYALATVTPNWVDGVDGDPKDFPRFRYALATVGPNWIAGVDGDPKDFPRFRYALANVDNTQPCPHIRSVVPAVVESGQSVTISGQGLVSASSPTADAWGAEVRLHETADLTSPYVVLPVSARTAGSTTDTVTVTVPGGAESGWVAVHHTVTPSCDGSNLLGLAVNLAAPDPDAGWWAEVWSLDNATPIIRPLTLAADPTFEQVPSDVGRGSITVPFDHPHLAGIVDPRADPPVETLVKIYVHGRYAYGFRATGAEVEWGDDGVRAVRISGPGQESIASWGLALWRDYPAQPAQARTWLYGSDTNLIDWGSFEEGDEADNGGLEDGDEPPWEPIGGQIISDTALVHTGAWALKATPTAVGHGARQPGISVEVGWRVFVDVWVATLTLGTQVVTVRTKNDAGTVLATTDVTLTSTYQRVGLNWVAGSTGVNVEVVLASGVVAPFYIDDLRVQADPGPIEESRCTVRLQRSVVADGETGLEVAFDAGGDVTFNGPIWRFDVEPHRQYTHTLSISGPTGNDVKVDMRLGGIVSTETVTLTGNGNWHTVTLTGTAGTDDTVGRVAIGSQESGAWTAYVDAISAVPGLPAATVGDIVGAVVDAMQDRGTLPFLTRDFDAVFDSSGAPWPELVSIEISPEWSLLDLLVKLRGFGYEWEIAPVNWRTGGDTGWQLRIAPLGRLGFDWTTEPAAPTILPGPVVASADGEAATPQRTVVYAEGPDGGWSVAQASPAWVAALGRREELVENASAISPQMLFAAASTRLRQATVEGDAFSVDLTDFAATQPYLRFLPLDTIRVALPYEPGRDEIPDGWYRAVAVTFRTEAEAKRWTVHFGRYRVLREQAAALFVARMMAREAESLRPGDGSVSSAPSRGGTAGTGVTVTTTDGGVSGPSRLVDLDDVSVAPTEGDVLYASDTGLWVPVSGTKSDGRVPTIQADGTVAWETPAGGGGVSFASEPAMKPPATPHASDLEFNEANGTDPTTLGLSWVNQGSATATVQNGSLVLTPPPGSGFNARILYVPAPATPWTATTRVALAGEFANTTAAGVGVMDPATNRLLLLPLRVVAGGYNLEPTRANSPTSWNGAPIGTKTAMGHMYLRLSDDGTTLSLYVSYDGLGWGRIHQETRATWVANPARVFLFANQEHAGSSSQASFAFLRFNWTPDFDPTVDS